MSSEPQLRREQQRGGDVTVQMVGGLTNPAHSRVLTRLFPDFETADPFTSSGLPAVSARVEPRHGLPASQPQSGSVRRPWTDSSTTRA